MKYVLFVIFVFLINCNKKVIYNCENYYNKYVLLSHEMNKDSAFYYLEKAIECNPKDKVYKFEKVNIFLTEKRYNETIFLIEDSKGSYFEILEGLILLKINKEKNADKLLQKQYLSLKEKYNNDNSDFDIFYYKILLDYYFNNRDFVLNEIKDYSFTYTDLQQINTIKSIEKLIEDYNAIQVLNFIFKVPND